MRKQILNVRTRSEAGYSMVDILIALLVVSIGAAITIPGAMQQTGALTLQTGAEEMVFDLNLARMKAIAKNARCRVLFDTSRERFQVQLDDGGTWVNLGSAKSLPKGVDLVSASTIVFQSVGTAENSAVLVLQSSSGESRTIQVNIAGGVEIS